MNFSFLKLIGLATLIFTCNANTFAQGGTCATAAANPISLPFSGNNLSNCGAGNNYTSTNTTACGSTLYLGGDDQLFAFTPTTSGMITINLTSTSSYVGLMLFQGCPAGGTCVSSSNSSAGNQGFTANVTAGTTYYLMVDAWPSPTCHPSYNLSITAPGVGPTPTAQDCQGAIPVCQTTYSTTTSYSGTGNYPNEINSANSCLASGELNDVWYIFTVQQSGNLCFTITPNTLSNDYDWALYNLTNANCTDIANNATLEVSCNYSGVSGATGANGNGGSQNNACVAVTAGQTFVLNVSNFSSSQSGYTLSFANSTAVIFDNVPPVFQSVATPISCGATTLSFNFSENVKCSSVSAADFALTGPGGPYTITAVSGSACASGAPMENTFTVTVSPAITTSGTYNICLTNNAGSVVDNCNNTAAPACFAFNVTGVTSTTSQVNVTCPGGNNGSASATPAGGSGYTYLWSNGATTSSINNLTPGTYSYTVTASNGCSAADTVIITTLNPTPVVSVLPSPATICVGSSIALTASGATSYTWAPATALSATTGATVTASPSTTTTYIVTGTGTGGCTATTTATVTVNPLPTVSVTASPSTICSGSSSTLNATAAGGAGGFTYSWTSSPAGMTSTVASPSVSPTVTTTYTVTVTDAAGCTTTGTVTVNVLPPVVLTPTASPSTICAGSSSTLNAGATGGNGSYTYSWSSSPSGFTSTSASPTVNPTVTTTYTVTVNSGVCTATQSVTVTVVPPIIVSPTASPATICAGASSTLSAGATGGTGTYTYSWTSSPAGFTSTSSSPTVSPSVTTTYSVTVSSGGCTQTGTVTINVIPAVVVNPTASPSSVCSGSASVLNAGATGGTGTYSYNWSSSPAGFSSTSSSPSVSPTVTTVYNVTVTSGGCTSTGSVTVYVFPQPAATISGTDTICAGSSGTLTVTLTGTAPWTITYSNGSATGTATTSVSPYQLSVSAPGTYTITNVTDANCTGTATGSGTIIQLPPLVVSNVTAVCDSSSVFYVVSFTISGGDPSSYSVSPAGTLSGNTFTSNNIPSGNTYSFTVTDATGCTTQTVTGSQTCSCPATAALSGGSTICPGDSTQLSVVLGGTGPWTIGWTDGSNTGTYSNIASSPFTFYVSNAGTYTLTSVSDANCTGSATGSATVNLYTVPTATISGGGTVCPGDSAQVSFSFTGTGPWSYSYSDGSNTMNGTASTTPIQINSSTAGTYSLISVADANCIGTVSGSAVITNYPVPTANISGGGAICNDGSTTTVNVNLTGTSPWSFTYSDGTSSYNISTSSTPYIITTSAAGPYTLLNVSDANCTGTVSGTATVIVNPLPVISASPSSPLICTGSSVTLTASGGTSYSWSPATGLSSTTGSTVSASPSITTTYTITGTDANGCVNTGSVTVTVASSVIANAGPDTSICANYSANLNASGGTGYLWSPAAGLSDVNIANPVATPTVTTTYQVIVSSGTCSDTDFVTVNVNTPVAPQVTPSATSICIGNSATLVATGGNSFTWSPATGLSATNNDTVTANPSSTTNYTVTSTDLNGCIDSTQVLVTVNPLPVIMVSPDTADICIGGSTTLSASGAGAGGSYTWSPASGINPTTGATVTASPAVTTTYTIIGTTAAGCTNSGQATVNVNTQPPVSVSPAAPVLCQGDSVQLMATGATNYSWTPNAALSSTSGNSVFANPNSTTTYTVTGTDANGCSGTVNVTVTVNPLPVVSAVPVNTQICEGSSVNLSATGATTYSWSPQIGILPATGQTITASPTVTTIYTVTGTDANGCQDTAQSLVVVNSLPALVFNPQQPVICNGASTTINVSGASNYQWNPSGSLSSSTGNSVSAFPTVTTTYVVNASDGNNCQVTDSVTVTVNQLPQLTFSPAAPVICAGDSVNITVNGASQYTWAPAAGLSSTSSATVTANPANTITYLVSGSDANSCSNVDSVLVTVNPLPQVAINSIPSAICIGDTALLTATGANSYTWAPSITNTTALADSGYASPAATTNYTVTGTDLNGCSAGANYTLTVNPLPVLSVTASPLVICIGQSSVLTASGANTYSWSPSGTLTGSSGSSVSASPVLDQVYTATGTSSAGCVDSVTVLVTVHPPVSLTTMNDTSVCQDEVVQLTAQATGGNGGPYFYTWSPATGLNSTNGPSVILTTGAAGVYNYQVIATDNCGSPADTSNVVVTVNALPAPSFSSDINSGCVPVAIQFANTSNVAGGSCLWDFGNGDTSTNCNPQYTYLIPGDYSVSLTVSDTNGCTATQPNYVVQAHGYPDAEFTFGPQPTTIVNPVITFNSEASSSDVTEWLWNFNNLGTDDKQNTRFMFAEAGTFPVILYVWNQYGCLDSVSYDIIIQPDVTIYIPNAFTPNNDNLNDTWGPVTMGLENNDTYQLNVFDRWGELVFYSTDPATKWNGTPLGRSTPAPQDVYVYKLVVKDHTGKTHLYEGHVSLLR